MGNLARVSKAPTSHPDDLPKPSQQAHHHSARCHSARCQGPRVPVTLHPARASTQTCGGLVSSHITSARVSYAYPPRHHLTTLLRNFPTRARSCKAHKAPPRISPFCRRVGAVDLRTRGNGRTSEVVSASISSRRRAIILPAARGHTIHGHESPLRRFTCLVLTLTSISGNR